MFSYSTDLNRPLPTPITFSGEANSCFEVRGNYLYIANNNMNTSTGYIGIYYAPNYYNINQNGGSYPVPVLIQTLVLTSGLTPPISLYPTDQYLIVAYYNGTNVNLRTFDIQRPSTTLNDLIIQGNLSVQGNEAYKFGSSSWNVPSDARLKTVIQPLDQKEALNRLSHLSLSEWKWKDEIAYSLDDYKIHRGILAQDLQKIYPDYVKEISSSSLPLAVKHTFPSILTIDSGELIYELIGALQELNKKYDDLKNEIKKSL